MAYVGFHGRSLFIMADHSIQHQLLNYIEQGDLDQIRSLIAAGADVNFRGNDPDGETTLNRAIAAEQPGIVRLLIKAGADVNSVGRLSGWSPLMAAHEQPLILQELIAAGADVNARSVVRELVSPLSGEKIRRGGETALHFAAAANNSEAIRILIDAGADVEAVDENGCSPLDVALKLGSPTEAAVLLTEAGAKLTPERLEAMHSGVLISDIASGIPPGLSNEKPPENSVAPSLDNPAKRRELNCPKCGARIYSNKTRICGKCGELLSPKLHLSDDQQQIMEDQRKWAQDIADKFDPIFGVARKNTPKVKPKLSETAKINPLILNETLHSLSCASEFKYRKRRTWIYVIGCVVSLYFFGFVYYLLVGPSVPFSASSLLFGLIAVGMYVFYWYRMWNRDMPICPNCKQDIRTCPAENCHVCGKPLRHGRCAECGVDQSWMRSIKPWTGGAKITFCPGCGIELSTSIYRFRDDLGGH